VGSTDEGAKLEDFAPAKINLTLRVVGRRADGYHLLHSLVVFARVGDGLTLMPGNEFDLQVAGPLAHHSGPPGDNLVLKAARALASQIENLRVGTFHLTKELPAAAGIGGGSSDAAAALRLLAKLNGISISDPRLHAAALATGADVPVCLDPRSRFMSGIGEVLSRPISVQALPAVLVNPGVAVPTRFVFQALGKVRSDADHVPATPEAFATTEELLAYLITERNDLEAPAVRLEPAVGKTLSALREQPGARLVRMSGSGATCFAIFRTDMEARRAASAIQSTQPAWWIRATELGAVG
jgi:4-diphosphocytidyl-2-C-methyl-D-erythritol kinase